MYVGSKSTFVYSDIKQKHLGLKTVFYKNKQTKEQTKNSVFYSKQNFQKINTFLNHMYQGFRHNLVFINSC